MLGNQEILEKSQITVETIQRPDYPPETKPHLSPCRDIWPCSPAQTISRCKERRTGPNSSKWGLKENVAPRLMKCSPPTVSFHIFMNKYFTFFHLLFISSHIFLSQQHLSNRCAKKTRLGKCTIIGDKQLQKKECVHFQQRISIKNVKCDQGLLKRQQGCLHRFF